MTTKEEMTFMEFVKDLIEEKDWYESLVEQMTMKLVMSNGFEDTMEFLASLGIEEIVCEKTEEVIVIC